MAGLPGDSVRERSGSSTQVVGYIKGYPLLQSYQTVYNQYIVLPGGQPTGYFLVLLRSSSLSESNENKQLAPIRGLLWCAGARSHPLQIPGTNWGAIPLKVG